MGVWEDNKVLGAYSIRRSPGGGDSHMKGAGMLVGNSEVNP